VTTGLVEVSQIGHLKKETDDSTAATNMFDTMRQ